MKPHSFKIRLTILFVFFTTMVYGQWSVHQVSSFLEIKSISMVNDSHGYATDGDAIFITSNGGQNWTAVTTPKDASSGHNTLSPLLVYFFNEQEGIVSCLNVLTSAAEIWRTKDSGNSWSRSYESPHLGSSFWSGGITTLFFLDSSNGYAAGSNELLLKTTDGGKNWSPCAPPIAGASFSTAFFLDINSGYVATDKKLFFTSNGGISWTQLWSATESFHFTDLHFFDTNTGVALLNGVVYDTHDGGVTWHKSLTADVKENRRFQQFTFVDAFTGYAIATESSNTLLFKTEDGGKHWESYLHFPYLTSISGMAIIGDSAWLGANGGRIAFTTNLAAATKPIAFYKGPSRLCQNEILILRNLARSGYLYEWWINGQLISREYDLSYQASTVGVYNIELKVIKGGTYASYTSEVQVDEIPVITKQPLLSAAEEVQCSTWNLNLLVNNLQQGVWYQVFDDQGVAIGEPKTPASYQNYLMFSTHAKEKDTEYVVKAWVENPCGRAETGASYIQKVIPKNFTLTAYAEVDTICAGQAARIVVPNTAKGVQYYLRAYGQMESSKEVAGTGGTIVLESLSVNPNSVRHFEVVAYNMCYQRVQQVSVVIHMLYLPQSPLVRITNKQTLFRAVTNTTENKWDFGPDAEPRYVLNRHHPEKCVNDFWVS
jgi:photosystem II stability/assembly factor-like uncharacterized protein